VVSFVVFTPHQYHYVDHINKNEMERHIAIVRELRNMHSNFNGKSGGTRPLWRAGRRRECNIELIFGEIEWKDVC
jgi:hypothetical protein